MGMKYGIRNYTRLLRVAKRDRDEELKQLKLKQQVFFYQMKYLYIYHQNKVQIS